MIAMWIVRGLVAATLLIFCGRAFIGWYFRVKRIESLLVDIAVSLRRLPAVVEYDHYLKRPPVKAA